MKRILCCFIALIMLLSVMPAAAEDENISISFGGQTLAFDIAPVIKGNTIMCQMDTLFDAVGIKYEYNPLKKTLRALYKNSIELNANIGEDNLNVDDVKIELEQPLYQQANKLMVPLDTICYVFNINIDRSDLLNVKTWVDDVTTESYDQTKELDSFFDGLKDYKITLIDGGMEYFDTAERQKPEYFKESVADVEGQAFDKAFDWEVTSLPSTFYESQLANWRKEKIERNDLLVISFWAKPKWATNDSAHPRLNITAELNKTWDKIVSQEMFLESDDWAKYYVYAVSQYESEDWAVNFRCHYNLQEFMLADVNVSIYRDLPEGTEVPNPPASYKGVEDNALWRKEALKRIEKYRKNDMTFNVTDESGQPIEGAEIKAEMTNSEFLWGAQFYGFVFETGKTTQKSGYWGENWLKKFKEFDMNMLVMGNENKPSGINAKYVASIVNWCLDNNVAYRCHTYFWETGSVKTVDDIPIWLLPEFKGLNWNNDEVSPDTIRKRMNYQYNKMATFMKDYPTQIDVINESVTRHKYILAALGMDETVRWFDISRKLNPGCKLYFTECGIGGSSLNTGATLDTAEYLKYLKSLGAQVDGVGLQGHITAAEYPQNWYNNIDVLTQDVDEATITEYDHMFNNPNNAYPYFRDTLIACYSHPKTAGFCVWTPYTITGVGDAGVLWNSDGTDKKTAEVWKELVQGEWRTNETVTSGADGSAKIRGHRGDYKITVSYNGKSAEMPVVLNKDEEKNVVNIVIGNEIKISSPNKKEEKPKKEYMKWTDWGKTTDIADMPDINYEWKPVGEIIECRDKNGVIVPEAFDNNSDTFWSASENDDYICVSLADKTELKSLNINWHNSSIKRYNRKIEISVDGNTWETVCSGTNSAINEKIDLLGKSAGYIKISGTDGKLAIDDIALYTNY